MPVADQMPQIVREHEILRVAATVMGTDPAAAAKNVRMEVLTHSHSAQRNSVSGMGRDMLGVGTAFDPMLDRADAFRRTVPLLAFAGRPYAFTSIA